MLYEPLRQAFLLVPLGKSVAINKCGMPRNWGARRPPSFHFFLIRWRFDLQAKPHAELHRAASAIEDEFVEELGRSYENVARVQGVGVCVLIERPVIARQADAVILMVERIEGLEAELHRCAFRKLHSLEQRHIPDIEPG